jgi:RNA polymerase sigma-70 factor (ECF subfamily)
VSTETEVDNQPPDGEDDAALVKAARKGELWAFDSLVKRYQRRANTVAYRLLNNVDDAMEVAQDAFLKAFDKLDTLTEPSRFGSWLLRIVGNLSLNRRRARALRKAIPLEGSGEDDEGSVEAIAADEDALRPDEEVSLQDVQRLIDRALAGLPENQRRALVMFSIENRPQKEVAKALGCSVEAVKWHVFTARKKLKEVLKDYL